LTNCTSTSKDCGIKVGIDMAAGMDKAVITCLSIDCPERTGGACNASLSKEELDEFSEYVRKLRKDPLFRLYSLYYRIKIRIEILLYRLFGYDPYGDD